MTASEAARLIEWLRKHGHTYEEAAECINYIAYGKQWISERGVPDDQESRETR